MLQIHMQALEAGSFYPAEPGNLTMLQSLSLQQIKNYFEEKDEAVIRAIRLVTHSLVNTMEDLYIEARMMDAFPGSFKTGILLNNLRFSEDIPSVTDEIAEGHHEVFIIINLLIQYAKSGDLNNADGYKGSIWIHYTNASHFWMMQPMTKMPKPAIGQPIRCWFFYGLICRLSLNRFGKTRKTKRIMRLKLQKNNWLRRPKTLSGTSKPVPSKTPYNHTPSSEDEERERLQSALDYETGRIALEKTDEISEGDSGGTSYDRNFSGSGYVSQAAEDMQRIVSQLAEESAAIRYEEELSEELQDESTVFPTETSIKEYISISTAWDMYRKNTESAIRKYFLPSILFPNDCRSRFPRY